MRIGELAARCDVSPRAIRHYEAEGLIAAQRAANGYRDFDEASVMRVRNIRDLLHAGLGVDSIRELADCLDEDISALRPCQSAVSTFERRLAAVDERLDRLTRVREQLAARTARLHDDRQRPAG